MEKILIPIPEFIVWASVSRTQIYREIHSGRLRLTKRGRRSFIARADATAWLDSLHRTPSQQST
jgi:hypothetical protein